MKNPLIYILLLPLCFFLAACPYESSVPISNAGIKTNPVLFGTWQDAIDTTTVYKVTEQNMFYYKILETHNDGSEPKHYLAYDSKINESTFLNLWEDVPGEKPRYLLYKLEIRNANSILLIEVTENIDEQFSSSDQLKKFIENNMNSSYFFSKSETEMVRVGK